MSKSKFRWMLFSVAGFMLLTGCSDNRFDDDDNDDDSTVNSADFAYTVTDALDANDNDHGDSEDYEWYSTDVISITLNGTSITESTSGATADGSTLTITAAGTYALTGTLSNGRIVINAGDDDLVRLILNGVSITNSSAAPIYVANADKAIIVLAESTTNYIQTARVILPAARRMPRFTVWAISRFTATAL